MFWSLEFVFCYFHWCGRCDCKTRENDIVWKWSCLGVFSCLLGQNTRGKQLKGEKFIFAHSPRSSPWFEEVKATGIWSGWEMREDKCTLAVSSSLSPLLCRPGSLPREWCPPQWEDLPPQLTSSRISHRHAHKPTLDLWVQTVVRILTLV